MWKKILARKGFRSSKGPPKSCRCPGLGRPQCTLTFLVIVLSTAMNSLSERIAVQPQSTVALKLPFSSLFWRCLTELEFHCHIFVAFFSASAFLRRFCFIFCRGLNNIFLAEAKKIIFLYCPFQKKHVSPLLKKGGCVWLCSVLGAPSEGNSSLGHPHLHCHS